MWSRIKTERTAPFCEPLYRKRTLQLKKQKPNRRDNFFYEKENRLFFAVINIPDFDIP